MVNLDHVWKALPFLSLSLLGRKSCARSSISRRGRACNWTRGGWQYLTGSKARSDPHPAAWVWVNESPRCNYQKGERDNTEKLYKKRDKSKKRGKERWKLKQSSRELKHAVCWSVIMNNVLAIHSVSTDRADRDCKRKRIQQGGGNNKRYYISSF